MTTYRIIQADKQSILYFKLNRFWRALWGDCSR